ncbi:MAG: hypothetical protein M3384_13920 [Acidobacteriota bacterium]|nr:hypothetical protein [Acidobacteriota bacterium]
MSEHIKESVRALLAGIVDYAGLFPPSGLSMPEAVINYATYKNSNYNWMLGRFVVPVARLGEFSESAKDFFTRGGQERWKLSVLASENIYETVRLVEDFNARHAPFAECDTLEIKADSASFIEKCVEAVPPQITNYFEIPVGGREFGEMVVALAVRRQRAKIRTGGTTPEAFPRPGEITRFIRTCTAANVPFKATAGLHHPVRCRKSLTYEKDAPVGMMYGFLNVFLAAAFAREGFKPSLLNELLEDEWTESFIFDANGVWWRQEHFLNTAQLRLLRERAAISFGSCSFEEPVADLQDMEIL